MMATVPHLAHGCRGGTYHWMQNANVQWVDQSPLVGLETLQQNRKHSLGFSASWGATMGGMRIALNNYSLTGKVCEMNHDRAQTVCRMI